MAPNPDPIAASLDALDKKRTGGTGLRVEQLFADRPEVLASIIRARRERGLSFGQIAEALSTEDATITAGPVQKWLERQGVR